MSAKGSIQNHFGILSVGFVDFLQPANTLRTTGDLEVGGDFVLTGGITLNGAVTLGDDPSDVISVLGTMTIETPLTVDVTDTEALLIRKNADAKDIFIVDTDNNVVKIANDSWLAARNNADDADVNMFKMNTSDEIDVGAQLNVGVLIFPLDGGVLTAMDMPVSSTPSDGDEMSYTFMIDSNPIMKIKSSSDGSGGADELLVWALRYISARTTITTSSDSVDISGCSVLDCDSNVGHITIGGFVGGVEGQILHLYNSDVNNIILEDDEITGNQDIKTNTGSDITITAEGGATLIYDGTDGVWRMIGLAQ